MWRRGQKGDRQKGGAQKNSQNAAAREAAAELKAHASKILMMQRSLVKGITREEAAAHKWLQLLRETFSASAEHSTVARNLHLIYDKLYGLDPRSNMPPCPVKVNEASHSQQEALNRTPSKKTQELANEAMQLLAKLGVEYSEISAPIVRMTPNVYFLCSCHIGSDMELFKTYSDRSRETALEEFPWLTVCLVAVLFSFVAGNLSRWMSGPVRAKTTTSYYRVSRRAASTALAKRVPRVSPEAPAGTPEPMLPSSEVRWSSSEIVLGPTGAPAAAAAAGATAAAAVMPAAAPTSSENAMEEKINSTLPSPVSTLPEARESLDTNEDKHKELQAEFAAFDSNSSQDVIQLAGPVEPPVRDKGNAGLNSSKNRGMPMWSSSNERLQRFSQDRKGALLAALGWANRTADNHSIRVMR